MTTLQYKVDNGNMQPENQSAFVCATILMEETEDSTSEGTTIPSCPIVESETYSDMIVSELLSREQCEGLVQVLNVFSDILTDRPGQTDLETFSVRLIDNMVIQ